MPSKYWFLKQIKLFSDLPDREMQRVEEVTRMESVKRRQFIFLPGDAASTIYLLKSGRVKLSRVNEEGKELTLAILEPGEVFGELEILEGMPRDTVAEALDDVSICVMQRADFEALLKKDPNTNIRLTKLIGLRLKKIESRIEDLVFKDVPARLAHLLIELSKEFGLQENGRTRLNVKISHQELANLIGSTRETVTATLGDFKRRGLIAFDGRRLVILREKELERLTHPPTRPA